jgi:uncharacterized membrane protein
MRSPVEKVAKTLGVKLPEEYVRFMEKYGKKLSTDPISQQSWVLGLGDANFVEGTTLAFRSKRPNFAPENVVIGYSGLKKIMIDKIEEEIDDYVMLNTQDGKILSVDSLGATKIIADGFEDWAGSEILAAELRDKYESTLTVILFDDVLKAEEARANLLKLQHQGYIDLEDIVVVVKEADGTARHHQTNKMTKKVAAVGSLTGLIAGALVLHPLLGAAMGAVAGAITASFEDAGIEDDFIMDLAANFKPGSSALFTLVIRVQPETVLETFRGFGGKILVTSMNKEEAARLQADLDGIQENIYKNQESKLDRIK